MTDNLQTTNIISVLHKHDYLIYVIIFIIFTHSAQ